MKYKIAAAVIAVILIAVVLKAIGDSDLITIEDTVSRAQHRTTQYSYSAPAADGSTAVYSVPVQTASQGSPYKYHYQRLNETEKKAYDNIIEKIYDMPERVRIPSLKQDELNNTFEALLYDNPDRFPTIVETMQKAEPNKYFKLREKRFNIAHKYGYLVTEYHLYINDCGIAFTDDPILLVVFTDNVDKVYSVLTEYCTLMCDYTQYHTAERLAAERAEAEAQAQAEAEAEAAAAAQAEAEAAAREHEASFLSLFTPQQDVEEAKSSAYATPLAIPPFLVAIAVFVAAVAAVAVLLRWRRRYRLRLFWAVMSAAFCTAALLLCTLAASKGTLLVVPRGNPQEAVTGFFDAVCAGDYDSANRLLSDCSSLGLEDEPSSEVGRLLYAALRESYDYTLIGECTVNELSASQQMQLRYLNISALEDDTQAELAAVIGGLAREQGPDQVYDADNNYLPAFAQEAYAQALTRVLSHAEDYYTTGGIQLTLQYSDGGWRIVPAPALLKALAGGLSY